MNSRDIITEDIIEYNNELLRILAGSMQDPGGITTLLSLLSTPFDSVRCYVSKFLWHHSGDFAGR